MALLNSTARIKDLAVGASATDHTALMRVVAPTNQKLRVKFKAWSKGTTAGDTPIRFTVRRGVSTSGGTTASITLAKMNGQDAETLQATAYSYSVTPTNKSETNNGTVVDQFTITPLGGRGESLPIQVNGGETLDLWGITATNAGSVDIEAEIQE